LVAAVPLTALPRDLQPAALVEVQHDAAGKKPTAKLSRAVVRRRQGGATVTAAGARPPQDAEATRPALPRPLSQLFHCIEALATVPDLAHLLRDIPLEPTFKG